MAKKYDVVIVGGGPSGVSAGKMLLKRGISCCIIDKEVFPRHKLCAGVLSCKTIELLNNMGLSYDFNNIYNNSTNRLELYYKNDLIMNIGTNTSYYFTDRIDFDNILINDFKKNGGKLYEMTRIDSINFDKNELILNSNESISFNFIIGADGANSYLRRYVDKEYKPNGFCVEIDIPMETRRENCAKLYFGQLKGNYGWVFPKKDHLTVGFGGITNKSINYKEEFNKYIDMIFPELNGYANVIKGHYLPFGNYVKRPIYKDKLLLVGDAAGLVDPVTGEGIYFSLLSGKYAAEAIIEVLESKNKNLSSYLSNLAKIHKIIDHGVLFQKSFYNTSIQKYVFKLIKNHNRFVGYAFDNLASYYNYSYINIFKILYDYKVTVKHK